MVASDVFQIKMAATTPAPNDRTIKVAVDHAGLAATAVSKREDEGPRQGRTE